jgi:hypothetical protein
VLEGLRDLVDPCSKVDLVADLSLVQACLKAKLTGVEWGLYGWLGGTVIVVQILRRYQQQTMYQYHGRKKLDG